jgi:hypothetical protein
MSLKSIKIHHLKKALNSSEFAFRKNRNLYKSFYFSENIFKMPRILKNKKGLHSQEKKPFCRMASPPLLEGCLTEFAASFESIRHL